MSDAAVKAAQNDPAYIASQAQQQLEAKKQTALLSASSLQGIDKIKMLHSAGLTEEAQAATATLPAFSAGASTGSIVNNGGTPFLITSNQVRGVSRSGIPGLMGQKDKIREVYGQNLLTGETVLLAQDNLSA